MNKRSIFWGWVLAGVLVMTLGAAGTAPAEKPIMIGWQSDYTRLITIGPFIAQGYKDYIKVFKSKGGTIDGHPVDFMECSHGYDVNKGLECYQRHKLAGIVTLAIYGTPIAYSLTPKLTADKIPGITPGFGRADSMDGRLFPYVFPLAASYWTQATASIKYILDAEGGSLKGVKIAYLYYDNPAGREPFPVFEKLQKKLGFKWRTFGVPSPGLEMGAQVTDITRRFRADWVIGHMFGKAPSVSLKELKRKGFPLDHYIGFVWNTFESDINAAGKDLSKGALSMTYTGLGHDYPIHREIQALYKKEGKPMHKYWDVTGYYNRGIFWAAVQVEAVRLAIKHYGMPVTGEKVAKGFEKIKAFTGGGLFAPLEVVPEDHEGGGWLTVFQWNGQGWDLKRDYFKAYRDIVYEHLAEVVAKAKKKK